MWKWLIIIAVLAGGGYVVYELDSKGFFTMPEMSEDSFPVAFDSGFRGVMTGFGEREDDRRYLGYAAKNVPTVYEEVWSNCRRPTDQELEAFEQDGSDLPGLRWEAVCEIDADGDVFIRGWVASIPRL